MRYAGKITNWKDDRGFGFITPVGGEKQIFVHINSFVYRNRRPVGSEVVSYEITTDSKGREQAQRVLFAGERRPQPSAPATGNTDALVIFAFVFLLFVCGSFFILKLPIVVLGLYIIGSIVSFFTYASDKSAAQKGQWRVKESTLSFLALIGGWPGALIAQRLLRHKTKKQSFQIIFWIVVIVNCILFFSLFTKTGSEIGPLARHFFTLLFWINQHVRSLRPKIRSSQNSPAIPRPHYRIRGFPKLQHNSKSTYSRYHGKRAEENSDYEMGPCSSLGKG